MVSETSMCVFCLENVENMSDDLPCATCLFCTHMKRVTNSDDGNFDPLLWMPDCNVSAMEFPIKLLITNLSSPARTRKDKYLKRFVKGCRGYYRQCRAFCADRFTGSRALFVFAPENPGRRWASRVVSDWRFEWAVLALVMLVSITLAVDGPRVQEGGTISDVLWYSNIAFSWIFFMEAALKVRS